METSVKLRLIVFPTAVLGLVAGATLPAIGTATTVHAATSAASASCLRVKELTYSKTQQASALRYWTPARARESKGFSQAALDKLSDSRRLPEAAAPASATRCVRESSLREAAAILAVRAVRPHVPGAVAATTSSEGYPAIGKLTFDADGVLSLNCTASVINGTSAVNNEELALTAAHCIEGVEDGIPYTSTDLAFDPMWNNNEDPYGSWSVEKVFLNSWMSCEVPVVDCSTNPLNDYAIVVLNPQDGEGVGDITGANGWTINQPDTIDNVTIAGIPGTSSDLLTTVTGIDTVTESGSTYREATTPGFTDGTSGGPWLTGFDTATGLGTLVGDIGGYEEGGPSSGSPSYSDYWNSEFATVVSDAVSYEGLVGRVSALGVTQIGRTVG
jgi:V8-like Glu-specific endopeptidase